MFIRALFFLLKFKKYVFWAFFIYLSFYGLSITVNYVYWALQSITYNVQFENLQHIGNLLSILRGDHILQDILATITGHIVVIPKFFIDINLLLFQGNTLIPNLFNIFLYGVILWILWRVVKLSNWNSYLKFIFLFFAMVMVYAPGNLYTLGPEHSIWTYLYVLVVIDLYLFIRIPYLAGVNKLKLILYHILFTICLLLTCLTFSNGILIIPTIIILFWLRKQYILSALYLLLGVGIVYFLKENYYGVDHVIAFNIVRILRYGTALLATPTLYYPRDMSIWTNILKYIRAFIVFVTILTILYHYVIKGILGWRKEKKPFVLQDWQVFFLGLILFAFGGIAMMALLQYNTGRANYGLTIHPRFFLNFNMMMIGLFVFSISYVNNIKKYYPFFMVYVVFYVSFILIPYTQITVDGAYNNGGDRSIVVSSMGSADEGKRDLATFFKMWDLNGYGVWQRHLMGKNIYTMRLYSNSSALWFIKDIACKACIDFYRISFKDSGKFGVSKKNIKTMHFLMYGRFPYWFSKTVLITDEKGIIMGLGRVRIRSPKYVNVFTIVPYIQHQIKNMEGYFFYKIKPKTSTYTLWAIGLDRRSIKKLFAFKVTPKLKRKEEYISY